MRWLAPYDNNPAMVRAARLLGAAAANWEHDAKLSVHAHRREFERIMNATRS